jgi:CHASE1-domain containing sensor protein
VSRNAFDQLVRDELHDEDLREIACAELAQKVEGLQHALRSARAVIEIRKKHQPTESVVAEARETLDSEREANDLLTKELAESQAREKSLRAALNLLWSWANNWDSEFLNDPDWKNRDFEVIQQALETRVRTG